MRQLRLPFFIILLLNSGVLRSSRIVRRSRILSSPRFYITKQDGSALEYYLFLDDTEPKIASKKLTERACNGCRIRRFKKL
jgi:hypothetical protein